MRPHRFDFPLITNSDYGEELSFQVRDTYVDLTGHSFSAQIKATHHSPEAIATLSTVLNPVSEGFCIVEPSRGALQVRILWETIKILFSSVYPDYLIGDGASLYYDMLTTLPSGDQEIWLFGYFNLHKGITNG